jgi:hypothetical protein
MARATGIDPKRSREPFVVLVVTLAVFESETGESWRGWMGIEPNPGRLNSAPQTVLKIAELTSADVHDSPPTFDLCRRHSAVVRRRLQSSVGLAVFLAVT